MGTKFRRHFITGVLEEVPLETENGKAVYVIAVHGDRNCSQAAIREDKPWVSSTIACSPEERAFHNEQLKRAGILGDAYYSKDRGRLVCTSRRARNIALGIRGFGDNNAGYGDRVPGG